MVYSGHTFVSFYRIFLIIGVIISYIYTVSSLECIQCDRVNNYLSPEELEIYQKQCQEGTLPRTPCLNETHTHCIYSYFRQGDGTDKVFTERKCGTQNDIFGCTIYKSHRRMKKHLFGATGGSSSQKRRETNMFVEVCTLGCTGENCLNASSNIKNLYTIFIFLSIFVLRILY
uniref:Protein quiver n=1 Tax=Parastrongyloides trichosuri TaxID=131310 RepID=A0A0N4ZCH5_PARTI